MIRLERVTRTVVSGYEPLTILDNVDLFVPAGQFVAVTGASGSGKSTLLSLVAGLDAPTSGEIYLAQQRITRMREDALADLRAALLGFVFQSFHLIPSLTAYENVLVPLELAGQGDPGDHAHALIDAVGLRERAHHYAKRRFLTRVTMIEYGVLGLLAGVIGSASSIAVTWVMSRWGNQPLPWRFHPGINAAGAVLTAAIVLLIGVAATWDVAARKPIGILKEQ